MRKDVANLLERLGRRDFQYQEFADRFSEVELWPIFETLIRDPRILTMEPPAADAATRARPEPATAAAPPPAHGAAAPASPGHAAGANPAPGPGANPGPHPGKDLAALFARYGGGATTPAEEPARDVSALLHHLAQQIELGKL